MPLQLTPAIHDQELLLNPKTGKPNIRQSEWLKIEAPPAGVGPGKSKTPILKLQTPSFRGSVRIANKNPTSTFAIICRIPEIRSVYKGNKLKAWASQWDISQDLDARWLFEADFEHEKKTFYLPPTKTVNITFDAAAVPPGSYGVRIDGHSVGIRSEQLAVFIEVGNINNAYKGRITDHDERAARDQAKFEAVARATNDADLMLAVLEGRDEMPEGWSNNLDGLIKNLEDMRDYRNQMRQQQQQSPGSSRMMSSNRSGSRSRSSARHSSKIQPDLSESQPHRIDDGSHEKFKAINKVMDTFEVALTAYEATMDAFDEMIKEFEPVLVGDSVELKPKIK